MGVSAHWIADLYPLIRAVKVFGSHLATVDLRQSAEKHEEVVAELVSDSCLHINLHRHRSRKYRTGNARLKRGVRVSIYGIAAGLCNTG